jgi:bifunctional NMN adenylyltransferase/nudix hydrolase
MNKYDLAVFIGRLQPFHMGHFAVINKALETAKNVVVLIGSTGGPRSLRNPFTYEERCDMIRRAFSVQDNERILIRPLIDSVYNNDLWVANVQKTVIEAFTTVCGPWHPLAKVALIGHAKDHTSFYLKLFPKWESVDVPQSVVVSATDIRNAWFDEVSTFGQYIADKTSPLAPGVREFLRDFSLTPAFASLAKERKFIKEYKKQWEFAPYPPTFVTVDAVVVQSGHVLLVQRKSEPGQGLWAMPGGFLNNKEQIEDAVIRELREETKIKVPVPVLKGSIKKREVFDDPERSQRGRTITHAFLFDLQDNTELPKVKGSDDAMDAKWVQFSDIKMNKMFEDHYHIIQAMTNSI